MPRTRTIARFFLAAIALYALGLALWLLIGGVYVRGFQVVSEAALHDFGRHGLVRFDPPAEADAQFDTQLMLSNERTRTRGAQPLSARHLGYLPTAVLVALIVATPIAWRMRGRGLGWGLLIVHLFIVCRILLLVLAAFSGSDGLALFSLGRFGDYALAFTADLFARSTTMTYLVPLLIWIWLMRDQLSDMVTGKLPESQ